MTLSYTISHMCLYKHTNTRLLAISPSPQHAATHIHKYTKRDIHHTHLDTDTRINSRMYFYYIFHETHLWHLLSPRVNFDANVSEHIQSLLDGRWTFRQFGETTEDAFCLPSEIERERRKGKGGKYEGKRMKDEGRKGEGGQELRQGDKTVTMRK